MIPADLISDSVLCAILDTLCDIHSRDDDSVLAFPPFPIAAQRELAVAGGASFCHGTLLQWVQEVVHACCAYHEAHPPTVDHTCTAKPGVASTDRGQSKPPKRGHKKTQRALRAHPPGLVSEGAEVTKLYVEGSLTIHTTGIKQVYPR